MGARPQIHANGFWLTHEEGHIFDAPLASALAHPPLVGDSVVDLGCGPGKYVASLRQHGIVCDGFDGNPNTRALTQGMCNVLDLSRPAKFEKKYDTVLSLEVAEHIPKEFESVFIENIVRPALKRVILSWAVPGQPGDGHVNCRTNLYAIRQLSRRGFYIDLPLTMALRKQSTLPWFANTLMVFSRDATFSPVRDSASYGRLIYFDVKNGIKNSVRKILRAVLSRLKT